ncbi:Na+-transporting NADH:ubiquinone oxidoreductase subunit C [Aquimarina sp. EL_43]|uniref:Na(+)-translocating NADH-quinone reductase subunit C n=1 Tax=unclassified Aquimarina TaxID=2627091 RepID=UPI0018CB9EF6|nr:MULTISPECIES: Na(+)-translocating NADH-quinone reductase subunit C [unclassified Aquimarina]MBG6131227.1 Na+-transporting NADH:ubiquinone oxidoreductase subunit C [Aquimarina sp. EL_35]MBG6151891.1 Na+-transporting NADH:ubiquinone oxidoreductase subunit C [Aquimarina sp. EL_32]MBG6169821.1 Na+-transporting NADH:ubiquinone oxidoreductase subunit C [Aquimarina sp. EL_43]
MAINTDKNSYTIIFAIAMVVVVGSLLAFTASSLKGRIDANKRTEKQQNILFAMGVADTEDPNEFVPAEKAQELFDKYVGDEQYIITGSSAEKTSDAFSIEVKKENDKVKQDPNYERKLPLFIGKKDGEEFYVVPMRGNGLWDAIWGYVSLDKEFKTVKGAFFDHKGETPGLGANIKEAYFRDDFIGESILDASGNYKGITVKKGNADPKNEDKSDNEVDAMAGATITGDGVTAMVKKGIKMYQPYFETLKK